MDKEHFFRVLSGVNSLTSDDSLQLRQLSARFPWFQTAEMLLLKYESQNPSELTEKVLTQSAAVSSQGDLLFEIFNLAALRETIKKVETALTNNNEHLSEIGPDLEGFTDQNVWIEPDNDTQEWLEEQVMKEALLTTTLQNYANSIKVPETAEPTKRSELDPFSTWLEQRSHRIGYAVNPGSARNTVLTGAANSNKKSAAQLIDDFINNSPKITPGKAEDYSGKSYGAAALIEDENFVTETLAAIYARQGKTGKAKKAYRLLSLKYPEKSVYFAAQIKKLDKGDF